MKRVILRYFWRELVVKGAIDRKDIPQRFKKWVDVSSLSAFLQIIRGGILELLILSMSLVP